MAGAEYSTMKGILEINQAGVESRRNKEGPWQRNA